MTVVVPTLSSLGWVRGPAEKADFLMSYFFESLYSQSFVFEGKISSFQFLMEEYGKNPSQLAAELQSTLNRYFGDHFENAKVSVQASQLEEGVETYHLRISAIVTDGGQEHELQRLLQASGKQFQMVQDHLADNVEP